jgi:hypothetical protein
MSSPLRVAVAFSGPPSARWVAGCLRELQSHPGVELALRVRPPAGKAHTGLARAYERFDQRLFARTDDALAMTESGSLVRELPEAGVEADVVVWLVDGPCPDGLADRLGCEVWCFRAPLHREILTGDAVSQLSLLRIAPGQRAPELLTHSFGATDFSSPHRGRAKALAKAPGLLRRALRARVSGDPRESREALVEPTPAADGTVQVAARTAWRMVHNRIQGLLTVEHWRMAVRRRRDPPFSGLGPESFLELQSPPGHFYADPMPFEHEGRLFVFFEDLDYATNKGTLRCTELGPDAKPRETRLVLERPYHLSYPFVFRWGGEIWMVPETEQNGTIELWRPVEFPWRWQLEKRLFEGIRAVDTTLLERDGRLWLFSNVAEPGASLDDELCLFQADTLHGPWRAHPANPIVADVRRARPAGPIFSRGGEWIRPAQDCSRTYGGAIVLSRIDVLNESEYRETPVERIEPSWQPGAFGTHTIGASEHLEVIDWKVRARARDHRV